jgi:hypothetical protein
VEIPPGCPSENTCVPQVYTENDSAIGYGTFAVTPVPEPASPAGFAVVCGGAVWALRRRKRAAVPA